ncbi:hypothetical protein MM236_17735 [Belliella sp. DSM 107340]|uniref:Uncharacterized protein n=1 Tax=Belliella calami TaxID=2923436 RepID=A0ABS9UTV2_9BACT|nr:hypothetical protein [Belliella calami]MCH7399840.1 hypothetical protein [Belliella calami]
MVCEDTDHELEWGEKMVCEDTDNGSNDMKNMACEDTDHGKGVIWSVRTQAMERVLKCENGLWGHGPWDKKNSL